MEQSSHGRTTSDLQNKARDTIKSASQATEQMSDRAQQQAQQMSQGVKEVAGNMKGALDKSIKDQPAATLAVIAAAGFVLGALWKR